MAVESSCIKIRSCLATLCVRFLRWLTVVTFLAVVAWEYHTYVFMMCLRSIENKLQRDVYLTVVHVLVTLATWCFLMTAFTPPGTIPEEFRVEPTDADRLMEAHYSEVRRQRILRRLARDLPIATRTTSGTIAYCDKCRLIKPDRAHHCSSCCKCILKMDHHCPWVNNCISFTNYKSFLLLVFYSLLCSTFVSATTLQFYVRFWQEEQEGWDQFQILLLFLVSTLCTLNLAWFSVLHFFLLITNRTTLEIYRPPVLQTSGMDRQAFNLGVRANFYEVFGDRWHLWFVPVCTSRGDGVHFQLRQRDEARDKLLVSPRFQWMDVEAGPMGIDPSYDDFLDHTNVNGYT